MSEVEDRTSYGRVAQEDNSNLEVNEHQANRETQEFERELLADAGCSCLIDQYHAALKQKHWETYGGCSDDDAGGDVFSYSDVRIAGDGGMSDVKRLLYDMQWLYAASRLVGVLFNIYAIAIVDIPALSNWPVLHRMSEIDDMFNMTFVHHNASVEVEQSEKQYLVTAHICCTFAHCDTLQGAEDMEASFHVLLPSFELIYMFWNVFAFLGCGIIAACAPAKEDLLRWSYVHHCFWNYFTELRAYSAMKLIYYVTPTVFATHAYTCALHAMENSTSWILKWKSFLMIVYFLFSRLLCLIIGFDSFLVKFRLTAKYVERNDMDLDCLLIAVTFLFQTLGAVKINKFVRERLFIFIFGGDDGQLDHDEKLLCDVWNALLARKIYEHFGIFKGTVVMLGFDDYDFQMLVLADAEQDRLEKTERIKSENNSNEEKKSTFVLLKPD